MQSIAQRILLLSGWRRALTAFLAGALTVLTLAPLHLVFIGFLTVPILVWLLDGSVGATPGRRSGALAAAFWTGWWFGLGYFVAGIWWMSNALLVEAPQFAWAVPLAAVGLPAFLAVFYGLACSLARLLWSDGLGRIFALAGAFGLAEMARSIALTGLPWNALGYAIMPVPVMMQSVTLVGLFGMSAFAVLVFALPAQLAANRAAATVSGLLCLLLVAAHVGFGAWRLAEFPMTALARDEAPVVRIVQPSIAQADKIDGSTGQRTFDRLLRLTALPAASDTQVGPEVQEAPDIERGETLLRTPDIVIWPETALPFILTEEPRALARIGETLAPDQQLLTGAIRREPGPDGQGTTGRYYNSVLAIDSDGVITGAADKVHLVPFGEYLPLGDLMAQLGLRAIADADRGYSAASRQIPITLADGITVLALICYEAIFPHLSDIAFTEGAEIIVNVTNDGWFGHTPGPYQHMHMARLRAVETGVPMVRVANNGVSVAVDPFGRLLARLDLDVVASADVALMAPVEPLIDNSRRQLYYWLWMIVIFAFAVAGRLVHGGRGSLLMLK